VADVFLRADMQIDLLVRGVYASPPSFAPASSALTFVQPHLPTLDDAGDAWRERTCA
jgi:hypothetical protein